MKKIIFSAIKPTGSLHIANYLGAIQNWVALQDEYRPVYQVADYHTITVPFEAKKMKTQILEMALDLLATGVDPEKSIFTIQSMVPEHTELSWILGAISPLSLLEKMPTYKEKKVKLKKNPSLGLLSYPVLQAADILIYKAEGVPVGEDQDPHIEFTRVIAQKFNYLFGKTFPEPKTIVNKTRRIMGLDDPTKKMSKSHGPKNYIALTDEPEVIKQKLAKAVTDTGPDDSKSHTKSLGLANLFLLLEQFGTAEETKYFEDAYQKNNIKYSELKEALAKVIAQYFAPFREKRKELAAKPKKVEKIMHEGAEKSRQIASKTLREVKEKIGLI